MPFEISFRIPVVKMACGESFASLLTAEGHVYTWGNNTYGELGSDQEKTLVQTRPDQPLKFLDVNNTVKKVHIIDIAASAYSAVAMTDQKEIFVWGWRMGIYPIIELNLDFIELKKQFFNQQEIN